MDASEIKSLLSEMKYVYILYNPLEKTQFELYVHLTDGLPRPE